MSSETLHSSLRTDVTSTASSIQQIKSSTIQPFSFSSFNLLRTISTESNNELAVNLSLSSTLSTNSNDLNALNKVKINKPTIQDSLKIGDYILFQPSNQTNANDTFNSAFNVKMNKFFYWKKFEKKNYMKKLEAFFIMESSERVYSFSEIILDDFNAYVIYDPHYGDLHTYMKEKKRLDEAEAKYLFKQCVEAVMECHENGIIVRDIKLKKFVFVDAERSKLMLANLEECYILDDEASDDTIKSQQGCPAYVSPEVLNPSQIGYSGRLSDSWSLGIILYTLLLGRYPFHHQTIIAMFVKITRGKFQIPPSSGLSCEARSLLKSLIRVAPSERLLPSEILCHNWLKRNNDYEFRKLLQLAPVSSHNSEMYLLPKVAKLNSNDRMVPM